MWEKIRKMMNVTSVVLEFIMALIVLVAIIMALLSLKESFVEFWNTSTENGAFLIFIGNVMNIIIGIEFFKMLCQPGMDTVLEVIMFVITRHLVIDETTSLENLMTIIGIAIIFLIKKQYDVGKE